MNIIELKNLTKSLLNTFLIAGQRALELRKKGLKTKIKLDNSPVTNGDLEVNKLLSKKIIQTINVKNKLYLLIINFSI